MSAELLMQFFGIVLGSNVLLEIVKWLLNNSGKQSPERKALLALCSERCETLLHKWMRVDDEDRTVARWAAIKRLYEAYRALNGNGEIEELYNLACEIKPMK